LAQHSDTGASQSVIAEAKKPQGVVYVCLFAGGVLNPSVAPFERIRQAMLDKHRPERPCRAEVNLAIEVDVAEFPIADVEVSAIDLRWVVGEPVRRSDNAGPGLDFL
jgi:hypothetical protein